MDESTNTNSSSNSKMGLIIGVVVVLVIAAGGYYYWSSKMMTAKTSEQPIAMENEESMPSESEGEMETLEDRNMMFHEATAASASTQSATAVMGKDSQTITVEGGNFYFKPNEIKVKAKTVVKLTFNNMQGFHDFVVEGLDDAKTKQITAGNSTTVEFTPTKKGKYEFYCSVGQHRQMGMKGTLIVE